MLALNDGVHFADTLPVVLLGHWSRGSDNFQLSRDRMRQML